MRPLSETRIAIAAALIEGGGTSRQIAQRICGGYSDVMKTLDNMVQAGEVHKPRSVRVPGVRRPVPWYERAPLGGRDAANEPIQSLIAAWAMRPVAA